MLVKGSHLNTLLRLQKNTDWSCTPIYRQFLMNGRWKHEDEKIYSEVELKYWVSYISQLLKGEEEGQTEKFDYQSILDAHFEKTMLTIEALFNQMNMMYFWEKIRMLFTEKNPTLVQLQKLMNRCLKLYHFIDSLIKVFKLIKKKEKMADRGHLDLTLLKRI